MTTLAELETMLNCVEANDPYLTDIVFDVNTNVSREVEDLQSRIIAGLANNTQVTSVHLGSSAVQVASVVKMLAENRSVTRLVVDGIVMRGWDYFEAIFKALSENKTVTEFVFQAKDFHDSGLSSETLQEKLAHALHQLLTNNNTITHITLNSIDIYSKSIFDSNIILSHLVFALETNTSLIHLSMQAPKYVYMSDYNLAKFGRVLDKNKTLMHLAVPYNHTVDSSSELVKRIHVGCRLNFHNAEMEQMKVDFAADWKAKKECFTRVTQTFSTFFTNTTTYLTEQVKPYLPGKR